MTLSILRTYLCDSYSARKLGRESTGSASRGGGAGVGASTSNFILQPGSATHDEIVKSTKRGLYVTEMMGFGFNAVTGDFSRGASGFWVENGKIQYPVEEITVASTLQEMFRHIEAIGADTVVRGTKEIGSVLIERMTVAGQ